MITVYNDLAVNDRFGGLEALIEAQRSGDKEAEAKVIRDVIKRKVPNRKLGSDIPDLLNRVIISSHGCWIWLLATCPHGYGVCTSSLTKQSKVHRHSWCLFNGPIPDRLFVLHKCDVRCCCNPDHLFLGTQKDNMRDCANKGRLNLQPKYGEDSHLSKLTESDVKAMRRARRTEGLSYKRLAKRFNVTTMTAYRTVNNLSWTHITDE